MANCNCKKGFIVATNYTQTIQLNATLPFTIENQNGNSITYNSSTNTFNLNKAGKYRITLSASAEGSADATPVSLQINRNNIALKSGLATFTPATAEGNIESMSVSTIVTVNKTCACVGSSSIPITITNTGSEATYTVYIITIEEL